MWTFFVIQLAIDSSNKCEFTNILKNSVLGFMNSFFLSHHTSFVPNGDDIAT